MLSLPLFGQGVPNVVIIYADDMGYGDVGSYNPDSKIPTPHLDALAAEGMRFTDAHSSSGICTPSRFALLTGQHHWRRFHEIVHALGESVFRPDDFTIAKLFGERGYATACIGKWHLGWNWSALLKAGAPPISRQRPSLPEELDWTRPIPGGPLAQGFDYYFGDGTINFPPYCWVENDRVLAVPTVMADTKTFRTVPEGKWEFRPGPALAGWDPYTVLPTLTDKAVEWIGEQSSEQPFFLYFSLPSPHAPIIPNEAFRGRSSAGAYGDFVVETDAMVGRVLQALERTRLDQDTLVIFTSDNGPEHTAYDRLKQYAHWSSGQLRGVKRDLWEGGHRVPFIVRWPGKIGRGSVSAETISQVDLAATFASLIGRTLHEDEAIDSHDLGPVLMGEAYPSPVRAVTIQNTFPGAYAIREGDWILIDAPSGEHSKSPDWYNQRHGYEVGKGPPLLYNLANDISQVRDLSEENPDRVARMKALLAHHLSGVPCAPHAQTKPPESHTEFK